MSSPLDPSSTPVKLTSFQRKIQDSDDTNDVKKFEEELEKQKIRKIDPDQKKERRRKQEEAEGKEETLQKAQLLMEHLENSVFALETPPPKKKTKEEPLQAPFALPSPLEGISSPWQSPSFALDIAGLPSQMIATEKNLSTPAIDTYSPELDTPSIHKTPKAPSCEEKEVTVLQSSPSTPSMAHKKAPKIEPILIEAPVVPFVAFSFSSPPNLKTFDSTLHRLSSDFFALLERCIATITLAQTQKGISCTTFCLDQPQFASSIFFGSQITIEECELAKGEFNICFVGSTQAVEAFRAEQKELEKVFTDGSKGGRFSFKVHRIETQLLS